MMKYLYFLAALLLTSNLVLAQKIARSSIGAFASSNMGSISIVSGNPISSPVLNIRDASTGASIQTRPFVHTKIVASNTVPEIKIYPNPTNDIINIKTSEAFTDISILDMYGRVCFRGKEQIISLANYTAGIYTVVIGLDNKNSYSQKIIIFK
jgi:hypothetical protein